MEVYGVDLVLEKPQVQVGTGGTAGSHLWIKFQDCGTTQSKWWEKNESALDLVLILTEIVYSKNQ